MTLQGLQFWISLRTIFGLKLRPLPALQNPTELARTSANALQSRSRESQSPRLTRVS